MCCYMHSDMNPKKPTQKRPLGKPRQRRKGNRPDFTTERGIAKRWKEGRGSGEGCLYIPWFFIREFCSKGYRTATWSEKFGRVIHLFSMLEWWIFLMLEADPEVISLKEQFPLPRESTREIAQNLGNKRHPRVGDVDVVMTTDFVITRRTPHGDRKEAVFVKWYKDLRKRRIVQKLEIERAYHVAEGTVFIRRDEHHVPRLLVQNLDFVRQMLRPGAMLDIPSETVAAADANMRQHLGRTTWASMCCECDATLGLKPGTAARIARHQIAKRAWLVDLTQPITAGKPLHLIPYENSSTHAA